jgi:hypothetical protein
MGRPRKRQQFVEATIQESNPDQNNRAQEPVLFSSFVDNFDYNNDSLASSYSTPGQPLISSSLHNPFEDPVMRAIINSPGVWLLGDQTVLKGPSINYGDVDLGFGENNIPALDGAPQLSTISMPPISESEISPSTGAGPCSCLASIYLSLAALQQFPSDIVSALKTVRNAAAIAAQTIWCPQCGVVVLTSTNRPVEFFQNTMLLGTLLPIVAHGYQRLLKMVDNETDAAVAANQTKRFSLHDYGGLCGRQLDIQKEMTCVDKDVFSSGIEMPPVQWRTAVRALLRVDIYGHETPGLKHKGLKDLVGEMECRQWARHELIDAAAAAGTLDTQLLGHGLFNKTGEKCDVPKIHGCLEMLKMAKAAIDNLIIA